MASFFITFIIVATVVLIMSVGVLFGRNPVQGSCGGMNNIEGMKECEICGADPQKCEEATQN